MNIYIKSWLKKKEYYKQLGRLEDFKTRLINYKCSLMLGRELNQTGEEFLNLNPKLKVFFDYDFIGGENEIKNT